MPRSKQDGIRSPNLLAWLLCSLIVSTAVALPHTGLLPQMGRNLFIDEVLFIDSAISFIRHGWVTIRGSSLAFDAWVTSGVLGSLLPGAATLLSGSYAWGRLVSAIQNACVLAVVAWIASQMAPKLRGPQSLWAAGLIFLSAALLVPAIPSILVYSQGEVLSFSAIVVGVHLYATEKKPFLAGLIWALAIHLKLIAILAIVGAVGTMATVQVLSGNCRQAIRGGFTAVGSVALWVASWHVYQFLATPTQEEYQKSWELFWGIFRGSGSGLRNGTAPTRWALLTTLAGGVGSMSAVGKATTALFILVPMISLPYALKTKRPSGILMISGASILHNLWWIFLSDDAWVRHGYIGLLASAVVIAWLGSLIVERIRGTDPLKWAVILAALPAIGALKSYSGWKEFANHSPGCPKDLEQKTYCKPESALKYRDWTTRL